MTIKPAEIWTEAQRRGIETVGRSILVSAAAGSGKTAVLAERCAHLVCAPEKPCDISELLVVTFTESAAAEMKSRIQAALRKRFQAEPSDRLERQVGLAQHAQVSTLHGFCRRLLKQNFTLAEIDPEFEMLDGDEAALLRQEVATELFAAKYESDADGDFQRLIDAYGDGNDERLIHHVIELHDLLASLIDPMQWIDRSLARITEAAAKPLEQSEFGRELIAQIDCGLAGLVRRAEENARALKRLGPAFAPYENYVLELLPFFQHCRQVLEQHGLEMLLSEVADFRDNIPRIPAVRNQPPGKDLAKSLVDAVKEGITAKPLGDLLRWSTRRWQDGMKRVAPAARSLLDLVSDFSRRYSLAKARLRALDFSDLERMTLAILRQPDGDPPRPSALARSLHARYRHVLVDEYQDINPIQDGMLRLLSHESVRETDGNLFCVGDVKQSIFRFRLAEPAHFLQRHRRFSASSDLRRGQAIHLRENFRSRAPLLDAINTVFECLMTREAAEIEYDEPQRLTAGRTFPPAHGDEFFKGAPLELHLIPTDPASADGLEPTDRSHELERADYEAILIAGRINEMLGRNGKPPMRVWARNKAGAEDYRPIEPGDIVVLLRAMRFKADRFSDVLRAHKIEVHNELAGGLLDATEVRDVLCLLEILDNQRQDIPLAAVLRGPLSGLPEPEDAMARVCLAFRNDAEPPPFHDAVQRYAREKDDELAAFLRDFLARLAAWRELANKRPVPELVWRLYQDTGYLSYVAGLDDGQQRTANLLQLHERAAQFGSFRRQGLYRFLKFIQSLRDAGGIERAAATAHADQAVRIMSIHRSKGLEFPVVFLADLGKEINLSDAHGAILADREAGLAMDVVEPERLIRYPSLASVLVSGKLRRQTIAEELRLLYVAMTRAKEHLVMIASCGADEMENWRTQWTGFTGALPAETILEAQRPIDWLGPVAAAAPSGFQVIQHAASDVREWKNPRFGAQGLSDLQKRLARLEPLEREPRMTPQAQRLIDRFAQRYPFEPFTRAAAAASVTSLVKQPGAPALFSGQSSIVPADENLAKKLDLPRFFALHAPPKATDIGNATHAVLQYFDFLRDANLNEIEIQVQRLVDRKLLPLEWAKLVDRQAVLWFLQSDVGQLIREHHDGLLRELPFALLSDPADCPAPQTPADQIMVRGRIDLLLKLSAFDLAVIDYKTDRVDGDELAVRAALYDCQMRLYQRAIESITRRRIVARHLVFLAARHIVSS